MGKHFAFVSMPAHGHVNPTLPLVTELVRRGHRVSYATGEDMAGAVRAAGADLVPAPLELPDGPVPAPSENVDPDALAERIAPFARSVENAYPVLTERFGADRPDAVCGDAMSPVTGLVAQRLDLPLVALHPSYASNEHWSLRRDVMASAPGAEMFRQGFARLGERIAVFAAGQGLEYDPVTAFSGNGGLNLVFIPREFQPAGDTFDASFVFMGPSVDRPAGDPDGAAWEPADPDAPLLLVSLGTVFNNRPDLFRTCAEAFTGSDWQVLMAIGSHTDPDAIGPLPPNVRAAPYVPQVRVLSRASAFVTHNGMNSTMEAIWFGVPQVGVPQMAEQEANARRVEELNLGRRLDPAALDAATLRGTVDEVVADQGVRAAVGAMSARLRAADGPAAGADALEAFTAA